MTITLGRLIGLDADRDAVHIAITPVVAGEWLEPGDRVGFLIPGDTETVFACNNPSNVIGVVDPYLTTEVHQGERFWLCLLPNTVTSLRHEWTHPAFAPVPVPRPSGEESRDWITAFAVEMGHTYDSLAKAATLWVEERDWTYDNSEGYKNVDSDKWPTFWMHFQKLTGKTVSNKSQTFFACSC